MVFDTTSCNRAIHWCLCDISKSLGKPIFWLACRHHVLELLLDNVFRSLAIEKSTTPNIEVFKSLKTHWNDIWENHNGNFVTSDVTSEILLKYQNLKSLSHLRDDYKELVELAQIYIGMKPSLGIFIKRPGAVSKAR